MKSFLQKLKEYITVERSILSEMNAINTQRIQYMAWVMCVVHIAHVLFFWLYTPNPDDMNAYNWRIGILAIHSVMFFIAMIVGAIARMIARKELTDSRISFIFQGSVILLYLTFAVVTCVIDQLVTAQILPFFAASIGIAVVILIHPAVVVINYTLAFMLLYHVLEITQHNQELLLSLQVNSITAIGTGFAVAVLLWKVQVERIKQQRKIEEQTKTLEEKNEQLRYLATHDSLTNLYNRAYFLTHVIDQLKSKDVGEACLVILDIDHFKWINDNYGHPAGDYVLKEIASLIQRLLQSGDIAARIGGEEFALYVANSSIAKGKEFADEIRAAIEDERFEYAGAVIKVTASFGVGQLNHRDNESLLATYTEVDKALYQAKDLGRNKVQIVA
ncbi:hypothetical protein BHU72_12810 [Desulfuribacillus stibiiarsenatis]|uniref:GGDEF domain-containing protein n=1 Tax=Desulfuribacillus stibiiarsenatis TaxID=1390249 RepID=A0A1E5L920_9FIRM|nr:GGDEF domain-containing protein [Desulfuribacillus stibiiarsenatis]OEH86489.1 hypothetical protein BHU72_12810 [Desulfuribacillus stibiiarsenatis]